MAQPMGFPTDSSAREEALFYAITTGDALRVRSLVAGHPALAEAVDHRGISAIRVAAYAAHPETLAVLLDAEPHVDIFDAAACGATSVVSDLLAEEPSLVSEYSVDGFTALHIACYFGHTSVVGVLLTAGADPTAISHNRLAAQPLNSAIAGGRLPVVHLLLDRGADVDARMAGGLTPLHEAAHAGDLALADALLLRGADPSARDCNGLTPVDLANGNPTIVALLEG